jgi:hypothetical protein
MIASRTGDGTSPSRRPPVKLPTIDLSAICLDETAAPDGEAAIASVTGEADDHRRDIRLAGSLSLAVDLPLGICNDSMAAVGPI